MVPALFLCRVSCLNWASEGPSGSDGPNPRDVETHGGVRISLHVGETCPKAEEFGDGHLEPNAWLAHGLAL